MQFTALITASHKLDRKLDLSPQLNRLFFAALFKLLNSLSNLLLRRAAKSPDDDTGSFLDAFVASGHDLPLTWILRRVTNWT